MNNIFFVIDENYVKQMLVTLNSIFKNNNGNDFSIYVVHSDLSETSQQDILYINTILMLLYSKYQVHL